TVRRQNIEDARLRASALARGAASGAEVGSGTIASYLTYMGEEQGRQMNWLKESGASRIESRRRAAKLRADATKSAGKTQQWTSLLQGGMGAFGYADQGGMFG
ncbi:unnamed protein product, partial [marine sediment metagenome]